MQFPNPPNYLCIDGLGVASIMEISAFHEAPLCFAMMADNNSTEAIDAIEMARLSKEIYVRRHQTLNGFDVGAENCLHGVEWVKW